MSRANGQDKRDLSRRQFFVAAGLEATERMCVPESLRETAGTNIRILFDSSENVKVFHCVRASTHSTQAVGDMRQSW